MSLDALPTGGVQVVVQAPLALGAETNHKMAEAEK
jgi:hypothetical protein